MAQTFEETVLEPTNVSAEPFYLSAEFWVGMAFVLAVAVLLKPACKGVYSFLSKRRESVIHQINEAQNLREDAQVLLAKYERKNVDLKDETFQISSRAEGRIEHLRNEQRAALKRKTKIKMQEAENDIKMSISRTRNEIYQTVLKRTDSLVSAYMTKVSDSAEHAALIDESIDRILKIITPKK